MDLATFLDYYFRMGQGTSMSYLNGTPYVRFRYKASFSIW